jgi:3'-phosphoadenosine 5'-phosphosulfate sulfotransferase (PAPS reductase)/FAD synthetase
MELSQKYISFSGGVESTTMCILYGKGAKAIFCDTGSEHKELYERLHLVEVYLKKLHGEDFEIIKVKADVKTKEGRNVDSLTEYIKDYKYMPASRARFCTRIFKIQPIENYLKDKGEIEMLIGLNYDEQQRTGNLEKLANCTYSYPLIQNELDRDDCIAILDLHGLNPDFPIYMQRGGCKFCFFKKEAEYKAMYFFDRDTFNENKELEKSIQDKKKKFFSIMPSGKSMQQLENECKQSLFSEDEMKSLYTNIKKTTYCGGFCHR